MRARLHKDENVDGKRMYGNLRKHLPVYETRARELHRMVGVEEGPYGVRELEKVQISPFFLRSFMEKIVFCTIRLAPVPA